MDDRHQHQLYINDVARRAEQKTADRLVEAASAAIDRYCESTTIRPGQVYRSCDPRGGPRIRITNIDDINAVQVVDAVTGKRPRRILRQYLHDSPTTKTGKPRRTGYALEKL